MAAGGSLLCAFAHQTPPDEEPSLNKVSCNSPLWHAICMLCFSEREKQHANLNALHRFRASRLAGGAGGGAKCRKRFNGAGGERSQNSAGPATLNVGAKTGQGSAADANAATDGFLARQRYQNGHWWYWGPNAAPAAPRQATELPDNDDARRFGQQNNNYFGAPAISRYSTGFGAHWNPYRGFDYGYQSGFGQNYLAMATVTAAMAMAFTATATACSAMARIRLATSNAFQTLVSVSVGAGFSGRPGENRLAIWEGRRSIDSAHQVRRPRNMLTRRV